MRIFIAVGSLLILAGVIYAGTVTKGSNGQVVQTYSAEEFDNLISLQKNLVQEKQYAVDRITNELAQAQKELDSAMATLAEMEIAAK